MPRRLSLAPHLTTDELEARYRQSRDPVERTHWQMLGLIAQGHNCPAVGSLLGYFGDWAHPIVHRYTAACPAGVTDRRHANPGQIPLLSSALREEFDKALEDPAPGDCSTARGAGRLQKGGSTRQWTR